MALINSRTCARDKCDFVLQRSDKIGCLDCWVNIDVSLRCDAERHLTVTGECLEVGALHGFNKQRPPLYRDNELLIYTRPRTCTVVSQ